MRLTIDIDEAVVKDVMKLMGESKKSPAISKAVTEYVKRMRAKEFGRLIREGAFDYPLTNDEIEKAGF